MDSFVTDELIKLHNRNYEEILYLSLRRAGQCLRATLALDRIIIDCGFDTVRSAPTK